MQFICYFKYTKYKHYLLHKERLKCYASTCEKFQHEEFQTQQKQK
jgi:hypothetical protein